MVTSVDKILQALLLKDNLCDMNVLEIMLTLCILHIYLFININYTIELCTTMHKTRYMQIK